MANTFWIDSPWPAAGMPCTADDSDVETILRRKMRMLGVDAPVIRATEKGLGAFGTSRADDVNPMVSATRRA